MLQIPDMLTFEKPQERLKLAIENEAEKKKQFGAELGAGKQAFEAACLVCGDKTSEALYISQNWLNDPEVLAAKNTYLKAVHSSKDLLDADALAAECLRMAGEKTANNMFYVCEAKDRISLLKLYAEIRGMIGKTSIDMSTKNITLKQITVKLVEPIRKEQQQLPIIENEEQILNNKLPIPKLKLVS